MRKNKEIKTLTMELTHEEIRAILNAIRNDYQANFYERDHEKIVALHHRFVLMHQEIVNSIPNYYDDFFRKEE